MRLARIIGFISFLLVCASESNAENVTLPITIQGFEYQVLLHENTQLSEKIEGVDRAALGKHYIGTVVGEQNSWSRASYINKQWQGVVSIHNAMHMFEYSVDTESAAASAMSSISSTPLMEVAGEMGTCGSGDGAHSMLSHLNRQPADSESASSDSSANENTPAPLAATFAQFCSREINGICVIAELEIAFDLAFQNTFGGMATAQAMSILNIVDGHYLNDLNISIDAITIEMLADDLFDTSVAASPVLDAGDLLTNIENKKNNAQIPFIKNNDALTHVVTGRDFDGGTLGVAYLGSVCQANGFSTGTSSVFYQNANDTSTHNVPLTAVVVAHELAHNLGSDHDGPGANSACPSSTYIMSPVISPSFNLNNFSSCSVEDIESTFSNIVNPQRCLDFPVDVSIAEDFGNSGSLDDNLEFTSSYTVRVNNGFIALDRVDLSGAINLAEGSLVNVSANGQNCAVAAGAATYTCTVMNPPSTFNVLAIIRVEAAATSVTFNQQVSEQTADVQDVRAGNDAQTSTFAIENNSVSSDVPISSPPTADNEGTTSVNNESAASDDGGGGGGGNAGLMILFMALIYVSRCLRRTLVRKKYNAFNADNLLPLDDTF